jgi:hypothetical protein
MLRSTPDFLIRRVENGSIERLWLDGKKRAEVIQHLRAGTDEVAVFDCAFESHPSLLTEIGASLQGMLKVLKEYRFHFVCNNINGRAYPP